MIDLRAPNGHAQSSVEIPSDRHADANPDRFVSTPPAASGRDDRGRFAAGNKGGPGNPFARKVAGLRSAVLDALSPDDLKEIIRRMIEAAKEGDVAAARIVLAYTVGKPAATVDPDAVDVGEWQLWQQMAVNVQVLTGLLQAVHVPLACKVSRASVPVLNEIRAREMAEQLAVPAPAPENSDPGTGRQPEGHDQASLAGERSDEPAGNPPGPGPANQSNSKGAGVRAEPDEAARSALEQVSEKDSCVPADREPEVPNEDEEHVKQLLELLRQSAFAQREEEASSDAHGPPGDSRQR